MYDLVIIFFVYRCAWWWRGSDHGVRLQADVQPYRYHRHRVCSLENGYSAGVGLHQPVGVDHGGCQEGIEPIAGGPDAGRRRGDGPGSGGRNSGYFGGRWSVAVRKDQQGCERNPGHQAHDAVLRRRPFESRRSRAGA